MKRKDSSKQTDKDLSYKEALQRAAALCSRQEQCTRHIREKLVQWNVEERDAERIIQHLTEEKFLDDHRYAEFFVKDKFRFNQWGKIKIAHMLRHKGIGEDAIQDALNQIDKEVYCQTCVELIRNKSATLKEKNQFTRKGKLYRFAAGRGFESDLIHRILNKTVGE
ncbi:MAG: RecX family transcriptional regulator [Bacteroidales bacterium]|nr:RecX family transcriptional regulator [Bacteroidales bacterium]